MHRISSLLLICLISFSVQAASVRQLESQINRKDYAKAASTGLEILRMQPNNAKVEFLTALAFQYDNQTDKAREHYLHIIQNHPNLPEPRNNLALIYLQQGQHEEAIDLLISSMQTNPAYATIWQNLKSIYQGLASEAYRKALNSENSSSNAMEGIELSELTTLSEATAETPAASTNKASPAEISEPTSVPELTLAPALVPEPSLSSPVASFSPPKENIEDQLTQTLLDWASAWSAQDIEQYINAYTDDYRGSDATHEAWIEQRRSRILKPGKIRVELNFIKIKSANATRAVIDFQQNFSSPGYQDKVIKRITLSKINDDWKISREITIAVL